MEDALKSPYQPCKLLNKILPEKLIDFFFRRNQKKRNEDQFSKLKSIENNKALLPSYNDTDTNSISAKLDKALHKNNRLENASEAFKNEQRNWYVNMILIIKLFTESKFRKDS